MSAKYHNAEIIVSTSSFSYSVLDTFK